MKCIPSLMHFLLKILGLVRIEPYEEDSVDVTFFSSKTVSVPHAVDFFGVFKKVGQCKLILLFPPDFQIDSNKSSCISIQYLYFPWICITVLIFLVKEFCLYRAQKQQDRNQENGRLLTMENDKEISTMTISTFLFLTKHGSSLTIIDGYGKSHATLLSLCTYSHLNMCTLLSG